MHVLLITDLVPHTPSQQFSGCRGLQSIHLRFHNRPSCFNLVATVRDVARKLGNSVWESSALMCVEGCVAMAGRAVMALPRWQRSGGREFVFYHSHSGFEWDDLETTNKYQDMLCHDFQVSLCVRYTLLFPAPSPSSLHPLTMLRQRLSMLDRGCTRQDEPPSW